MAKYRCRYEGRTGECAVGGRLGPVLARCAATPVDRWDVSRLTFAAQHGYFPQGPLRTAAYGYAGRWHAGSVPWTLAYFPGQPLVLRAAHGVVGNWVAAGLLVSLVSGALAVVALARLADLELSGLGPRAVLALVAAPFSVFLAAGYSEALFLACGLWSWSFARVRVWWAAGLLGALAATTRITGVFLGVALVVEWLAWRRDDRTSPHPAFAFTFSAEILAVAVGVGLTGVLLAYHRWGEASYIGLQIVAFATSTQLHSVTRATLLWWPLWLLLARSTTRYPRLGDAYLGISAPLAAAVTWGFVTAHWVG